MRERIAKQWLANIVSTAQQRVQGNEEIRAYLPELSH